MHRHVTNHQTIQEEAAGRCVAGSGHLVPVPDPPSPQVQLSTSITELTPMIIDFLVTICISPLQSLIVNRARSKPGFYFSAIEAHNRPAGGGAAL